jgi:hypothetical protein
MLSFLEGTLVVSTCEAYTEASKVIQLPSRSCPQALVESIEKAFCVKTSRVNSPCDCEIKDRATLKTVAKLDTSEEIIELSLDVFSRIAGYNEGVVSSYHPKSGRIFLIKGKWCFSNLIHEILHSRSTFSKETPPSNLEFISEGLTELLVGLVLKKTVPCCYEKWRTMDSCFLNPYEKFVKPWYYLASKADFAPIISLYFDVTEKRPIEKLGKLLEKAHDSKLEELLLNYDPHNMTLFQNFTDRLGTIYSPDFAEFQGTSLTRIDLDYP